MWHPEQLDTRSKIVPLEAALAGAQPASTVVVTGYFDPLLNAQARRLREIRDGVETLIVVVCDPPAPILTARARAELVAALDSTTYVAVAGPAESLDFGGGLVVREEAAHCEDFRKLVERVHAAVR